MVLAKLLRKNAHVMEKFLGVIFLVRNSTFLSVLFSRRREAKTDIKWEDGG